MTKSSRTMVLSLFLTGVLFFGSACNVLAGDGREKVEAARSKGMPVFVDFGKTTCIPCKKMVPVLDKLTRKYKGKMDVVFVNVGQENDYALKMGVTMIPTQVLLDKNGKEVARHVGYMPVEDCEKMIGKALNR